MSNSRLARLTGDDTSNFDFPGTIENLLRRPLVGYHIRQLLALREKAKHGELSHADEIYISDTWDKFRSLPASREERPPEEKRAEKSGDPVGLLAVELEKAKDTIARLRDVGKRAIAQRDEWEKRARALEGELAELTAQRAAGDRKFEQTKRSFAKLYHPNGATVQGTFEALIRGEVFKEFWAELERIEAAG